MRGSSRHQEGLSGSWVWMTGTSSLHSVLLRRGQRPAAPRQRWALAPASLFPEWVGLGGEGKLGPQELPSWPRSSTLGLDQKQGRARALVGTGLECCPSSPSAQALRLQEATIPASPIFFVLGTLTATQPREESLRLCWALERLRPRGRHGPALKGAPRRKWRLNARL